MTLFEYLAIAYSLIVSFAVSRLLSGLSAALSSDRRYWIHLAYVAWLLACSLMVFWNFWLYRDAEWSLPRFMLALATPALLLMLATQIMPVDPPDSISWRDHFYMIRRRLCTTAILWILSVSAASYFIAGMPLTNPARVFSALAILAFAAGIVSRRPVIHGAIIVFNLAAIVIAMARIFVRPGEVGPINP